MKIMTILILMIFSIPTFAILELIGHSGTGCPKDTVTAIGTDDKTSLSIIFDEFYAEVPQLDGVNDNHEIVETVKGQRVFHNTKFVSHKSCQLSFQSKLPAGYKVDFIVLSIDSRGAAVLDQGVKAKFISQLESYSGLAQFTSGLNGGRKFLVGRKMFGMSGHEVDQEWTINNEVEIPINSRCAATGDADIDFKVINYMRVINQSENENLMGLVAFDSTDMASTVGLKMQVSKCVQGNSGGVGTRVRPRRRPTRVNPRKPNRSRGSRGGTQRRDPRGRRVI